MSDAPTKEEAESFRDAWMKVKRAGSSQTTIPLVLTEDQAEALAQFVKRVGWSEMRSCAVDNEEAYMIRYSIDTLRKALADVGFAPR